MSESEDQDIIACERELWQVLQAGDLARFADMLTGDFQNISPSGILTKQQTLELLRGVTLENHSIDDFQVVRPSGDTVAITYHLTEAWRAGDQAVCFNGFASSVWVEIDGSWRLVLHVETPAE